MYLFVKRGYLRKEDNTGGLVKRSLAKLAEYTSRRPETDPAGEVLRTEWGKPYLSDGSAVFSVSHSGDLWVCLMKASGDEKKESGEGASIGVDIQKIKSCRAEELAERFFHEAEKRYIMAAGPEEERIRRFLDLWTEKEALGKALGRGIGNSLLSEDVKALSEDRGYVLIKKDVADGYICTCCVPEAWKDEEIVIKEL